ncbi:MAG: FAD-dependent oxidoreductase [Acidobacteriota bacterium]|nr:FAD-dependent oxidoreductase [Acidobacteriota bacterium]
MTDQPDLASGVPCDSLADGAMLVGRAGEEDVLLARRGDAFFAVSAFCPHYHAPMADGLIIGETIRCPWHHACFELRTGNATAAPALRPLQTFRTIVDGNVVRVDPKPNTPAKAEPRTGSDRIVIIGAGAAGTFAANELRRLGHPGPVTLISREESLPYDKPNLSKDYLAGRAPEEWIPLRSAEEYASDNIDLRLGATVQSIDASERLVHLASGETIRFEKLILATGASPRRLDLPNDGSLTMRLLRTWNDANAIRDAAKNAKRAVVIGASFIGLETAASLRELGLDVTVVGPEEHPLERPFGRKLATFIRTIHESRGVTFRLGRKPAAIEKGAVVLDDESRLEADLVVAGVGVTPDVALATSAGLEADNGIVVDEFLETSVAGIFAAGDIARFPSPRNNGSIRVEHWAAAARQGQTAARNAMGLHEPFTAVPFFWSQHYDLVFAAVGHATRSDDVEILGSLESTNAAAVFRDNGQITAVVTLFRDDVSLAVEAAMERGSDVEPILRAAFSA